MEILRGVSLLVQVCGVYGSWHLGQLQVGLSRAIRLAQCRSVKIICMDTLAVQIDGEPWQQSPATLQVSLKGQASALYSASSSACSFKHAVHHRMPLIESKCNVPGTLRCLIALEPLAYCIDH